MDIQRQVTALREIAGRHIDWKALEVSGKFADEYENLADIQARLLTAEHVTRDSAEVTEALCALERIRRGEYGVCEGCGEVIGEKRLRAIPYARLCIECKSKSEEN